MLHVTATLAEQVTCMDHACLNAISHESLCTCACGGEGHGQVHRPTRQAARDRIRARVQATGDVTLGAANTDRDIPVQRRPVDFCDDCFNAAIDCECEA